MRTPRQQADIFLGRAREIERLADGEPDEQRREVLRALAEHYQQLVLPFPRRRFPKSRARNG
jgi:hypothetical protein